MLVQGFGVQGELWGLSVKLPAEPAGRRLWEPGAGPGEALWGPAR